MEPIEQPVALEPKDNNISDTLNQEGINNLIDFAKVLKKIHTRLIIVEKFTVDENGNLVPPPEKAKEIEEQRLKDEKLKERWLRMIEKRKSKNN